MIREATAGDIPAVVAMGRSFVASVPPLSRAGYDEHSTAELLARLIEGEDSALIVADAGGLIGMLAMLVYPYYFNPAVRMAQELFWWVEPAHRRSGVAGRLLAHAEAWARSRGARAVQMIALDESDGASVAAMYKRRGYAPVERSFLKEF